MATRNSDFANPKPCEHLADYKLRHGLSGYKSIQKWLKASPYGKTSIKMCGKQTCPYAVFVVGRLFLCLICSSLSCSDHTLLHTQSENGQDIAVDIERSELYCSSCSDQVYDPDFDKVVVSKNIMDMPSKTHDSVVDDLMRRSSKRKRLNPLMDLDFEKVQTSGFNDGSKGEIVLSVGIERPEQFGEYLFHELCVASIATCTTIQELLLEDTTPKLVRKGSSDQLCLACDFGLCTQGIGLLYSPAQFLYRPDPTAIRVFRNFKQIFFSSLNLWIEISLSCAGIGCALGVSLIVIGSLLWWQHSANLASYEQQDAHEFFISVLDGIHEREGKERNSNKDNGGCQCIAHRVFSGMLRSDVTCTTCGFTSTTYDPCVDISLNMDTTNFSSVNVANKSAREDTGRSTLLACLDLFTRPERLGSDQKLYCQNCQEKRDSLKQMSIKRLPLVLSLHIKRFEHSSLRRSSRKIDWYLQFPFSLDMTPYLSPSVVRNRFGNRVFGFESDKPDISSEFEIFAVVTHSGMLDSGHYVTYLRLQNQWYKCDDAWVTEVDERIVRAAQCYMIFYVQKMLYCKANED
ncbi:LOW QUALITY PROTEIN: hypothetical protein NC652_039082 [Populus alba x Populus x berolinensis]|nr:LOW QUALITY PROTEIN: hypothetical protein NC652_039082 [Populus alba x Populus x berolinensis]